MRFLRVCFTVNRVGALPPVSAPASVGAFAAMPQRSPLETRAPKGTAALVAACGSILCDRYGRCVVAANLAAERLTINDL